MSLDKYIRLGPYKTLRHAIGDIEVLGGIPNHEVLTDWAIKRPDFPQIIKRIKPGQKLCNVRFGARSVHTWDMPEVFGVVTKLERNVLVVIAKNRRRHCFGGKDGNSLPLSSIRSITGLTNIEEIVASLLNKGYLVKKDNGYDLNKVFNGLFRRLRWDYPSEAVLTVFANPRHYLHPSQNRPLSVREVARIQDFPDKFIFCGTLKEQYTQIGNAVPSRLAEAVAREVKGLLEYSKVKTRIHSPN